MGYKALSWEGIEAYCRRLKVDLSPSETRVIKRLDAAYLGVVTENDDGHRKNRSRGR